MFGQAKTLVDIFQRIEGFFRGLGNYTRILPGPDNGGYNRKDIS